MEFVNEFRTRAMKYSVCDKEIKYIEDLLPTSKNNLIFTFEQFKIFSKYYEQFKDGM